ncbi:hypothetical protein [Solitalea lacus]|uniref:hypothetical protein n=1 Tax=Solitalea lacus TaxID=2911172 RepID=UPI001EDABCB9|nr:hypothetical protein [Solitalea lacus]UKJ07038.1 hypothetical protein L2B55_16100 [Solitalea lacus]
MKNHLLGAISAVVLLSACNQPTQTKNEKKEVVVSDVRKVVSPKPVATYDQKYASSTHSNDLNNWHFSVKLYETPKTFWYRMEIVDRALEIRDTVVFPNLGMEMQPALKKGREPYSCLVGFLDGQGNFLEYKKVVSGEKGLIVKQTQTYYVSTKKLAENRR